MVTTLLIEESEVDLSFFKPSYEEAFDKSFTYANIEKLMCSPLFNHVVKRLKEREASLQNRSRTAQLWLKYIDCINVVKLFIYAERTSDWEMHLSALSKMLNVFAGTGHFNYSKCARLYFQDMMALPQTYPSLHTEINVNHSIKRSEKHWSGIWVDLGVEQTLNRDAKSPGGFMKGRGMHESARQLFTLTLNDCALVKSALRELCGTAIKTETHVEMGSSRRNRDYGDTMVFYNALSTRNPFSVISPHLHNIFTGVVSITGKDQVNCEKVEEIGAAIQENFDERCYSNCTLKQSSTINVMSSLVAAKTSIKNIVK